MFFISFLYGKKVRKVHGENRNTWMWMKVQKAHFSSDGISYSPNYTVNVSLHWNILCIQLAKCWNNQRYCFYITFSTFVVQRLKRNTALRSNRFSFSFSVSNINTWCYWCGHSSGLQINWINLPLFDNYFVVNQLIWINIKQ